ncbi:MAG: glycoside hydrolase family 3 [Anaerolineae bacterium]|nr:glycoside hydrolase family 3 [Anaerolineae bacterium]
MPPRKLSRRAFLRLAALALAGCCPVPESAPPTDAPIRTALPTAHATSWPTAEPAPDIGLDAKIGQMLMIGFRGLEVSADHFVVRDIRERNLGGVVLFDYDVPSESRERNIASPSQLKTLVTALQAASDIPLLIAIDHEGGVLTRLKGERGFPPAPSHQALGEIDDPAFTYEQAAAMAQTLAELGITLNLAPVVDLNLNPDNPIIAKYERSFSADPEVVTRHARAFIEAHHAHGVRCTLKHFPGHGSSTGDTHAGWVDVTDTWSWSELLPFAHVVEAGLADAVMTAHVFNANLDADDPATLSYKIIGGLIRAKLAYDGVVISDDLQMGAVAGHYGFETAAQKAIEAGVDILAFANNSVYEEDVAARTIAHVKHLVEEGIVSEARIDASYRRIQRLKKTI